MQLSANPGVWIAALLTLGIFSFLYKDNPVYKFCEHLFVGVSAGYWVVLTYYSSIKPNLVDPLFFAPLTVDRHLLLVIPLVLSLFLFSQIGRASCRVIV